MPLLNKYKTKSTATKDELIAESQPKIDSIIEEIKNDVPSVQNLKDKNWRYKWLDRHLKRTIALQIIVNRVYREWTQEYLASLMGMAQSEISRLENPNRKDWPTIKTLLRLAKAFDVVLIVRFDSWGTVWRDIIITPIGAFVKSYNDVDFTVVKVEKLKQLEMFSN